MLADGRDLVTMPAADNSHLAVLATLIVDLRLDDHVVLVEAAAVVTEVADVLIMPR